MKVDDLDKNGRGGMFPTSSYLPPDYTGSPSEDDEEDEKEILEEDESEIEKLLDKQDELEDSVMNNGINSTPFGTPSNNNNNGGSSWDWGSRTNPSSGSSNWGSSGNGGSSWGTWRANNPTPQPGWMNNNQPPSWNSWGSGNTQQTSSQQRKSINRQKRFVICDILDCLVETYQSNGMPGLMPRGIYDIRLRFEVWNKIQAFNPERIYTIIPKPLITNEGGYSFAWDTALNYITCSLSEFLRIPYKNCQLLLQHSLNQQDKIRVLEPVVKDYGYNPEDIIYVGVYSGLQGQSDRDAQAAQRLGIDYVDVTHLINMYY